MVTPDWRRVFEKTFVTEIVDFEHGFLCEYGSFQYYRYPLKIYKRASRMPCTLEL